jgi:hypothetical protein
MRTFRPLLGPPVAQFQSGRRDLNSGPLVPQASLGCGKRSGKVAGSGFGYAFAASTHIPEPVVYMSGFASVWALIGHSEDRLFSGRPPCPASASSFQQAIGTAVRSNRRTSSAAASHGRTSAAGRRTSVTPTTEATRCWSSALDARSVSSETASTFSGRSRRNKRLTRRGKESRGPRPH